MSAKPEKPKVCEFCKEETCICLRGTCPIHGNTKFIATTESKQVKSDKESTKTPEPLFKCSAENCDIKRTKKEL